MLTKLHKRLNPKEIAEHRVHPEKINLGLRDYLHSLNCPRALSVWILFSNNEHKQLSELSFNPRNYEDLETIRGSYAATSLFEKASFLKLDTNRKDLALEKFAKFELQCKKTNSRFRNLSLDPSFSGSNVWLLNATIRKITEVLGDFSYVEFFDAADWGPGVTTLLKGDTSAVNKFRYETGITRDLFHHLGASLLYHYPLWSRNLLESGFPTFVVGNTVTTVPKTAKIDRVIAIEPGLNLWFQKAIGKMIRKRLIRCGIDLNDQSANQSLARSSSLSDELATIDFSSASDSISRELVRVLFESSPDWLAIMELCRSHFGLTQDKPVRWEKFSSMGNGFTFELESLIFYSAAWAVKQLEKQSGRISVYGDDVILPTSCTSKFYSFSEFLGFTMNPDKSYFYSDFRESCGSHYWKGFDVKPIYLKDWPSRIPQVFRFANSIRRLAHRWNNCIGCDSSFRKCFYHLVYSIPERFRFGIDNTLGDGGFIMNFDEARPSRAKNGIEGYRCRIITDASLPKYADHYGLAVAKIYQLRLAQSGLVVRPAEHHQTSIFIFLRRLGKMRDETSNGLSGNTYSIRDRTKLRLTLALVSEWYNLGPWI